jgi:hypothetical protein
MKILRISLVLLLLAVVLFLAWALWYYRPTLEHSYRSGARVDPALMPVTRMIGRYVNFLFISTTPERT